ncbi:SAM-dependent methyltransferase [Frankia sp. AiPa1]|uniref:SAM-dependent methyltransferase n=1 Tax=Frankia sp. AiPa1 TaxID=573492 RepID=UPI00202AE18A|nr:SAM-dependent methyltransferase [Frankia sp. AiPa1]MCL9759281.1 SAM-dependent methyltransferase [Frankia sp. AiPa1]
MFRPWSTSLWRGSRREGPVDLNTDQPHSARIYDYLLGGKDHFPADREAAGHALASFPHLRTTARQNRAFMTRAVRYLTAEAGIRQFLDIGTGIPTSPNLHEVAQAVAPDARIVYADSDPIVLSHARALLTSSAEGATAYLDADLRSVESILASPELRETLDLSRPVAVSLVAILHFFPDEDDPHRLVRQLLAAFPSGSYLVLSHGTADFSTEAEEAAEIYRARGVFACARTRDEIERFADGLDLIEPGVVSAHHWRPAEPSDVDDAEVGVYSLVARKP